MDTGAINNDVGAPSVLGAAEIVSPLKKKNKRGGRNLVEIRRFIRPEIDTEDAAFVADCYKQTKKPSLYQTPKIQQTGMPLNKDPSQKRFLHLMTMES